MIDINDVKKIYISKKGVSCTALNGINLKLPDKGMVFILGKSGSGKSTFLNLIGGIDKPSSGKIIINGKNLAEFSSKEIDAYRANYVGFVFQDYNLINYLTVKDNLIITLGIVEKQQAEQKVSEVLKMVGLSEHANRFPEELSGGQCQRIAIARAILKEPKLILADEPTGNLDNKNSADIMKLLKELSKSCLVLIVSHDKESAKEYGEKIVTIEDGLVVSDEGTLINVNYDNDYTLKNNILPLRHLANLALHNFKIKKLVFILALFICIFSISMLSYVQSINNFNIGKNLPITLEKNDTRFFTIAKENDDDPLLFTENKYNEFNEYYDNIKMYKVIKIPTLIANYNLDMNVVSFNVSNKAVIIENSQDIERLGYTLIEGYQELSEDVIYITDFYAEGIINNGCYVYENNEFKKIKTLSEMMNKSIYSNVNKKPEFFLGGIIKTDYENYIQRLDKLSLKEKSTFDYLRKNFYFNYFASKEFVIKNNSRSIINASISLVYK